MNVVAVLAPPNLDVVVPIHAAADVQPSPRLAGAAADLLTFDLRSVALGRTYGYQVWYGEYLNSLDFTIDKEEAQIVLEIFSRYVTGNPATRGRDRTQQP